MDGHEDVDSGSGSETSAPPPAAPSPVTSVQHLPSAAPVSVPLSEHQTVLARIKELEDKLSTPSDSLSELEAAQAHIQSLESKLASSLSAAAAAAPPAAPDASAVAALRAQAEKDKAEIARLTALLKEQAGKVEDLRTRLVQEEAERDEAKRLMEENGKQARAQAAESMEDVRDRAAEREQWQKAQDEGEALVAKVAELRESEAAAWAKVADLEDERRVLSERCVVTLVGSATFCFDALLNVHAFPGDAQN